MTRHLMEAELLPVNVSRRSNAPIGLRYFEPHGLPSAYRLILTFFSRKTKLTTGFYHGFFNF